jgi:phage terminase small subunit
MRNLKRTGIAIFAVMGLGLQACTPKLTPEQKQSVVELKQELVTVRQDIDDAEKENSAYAGGLIKSLIGLRLEVLKTNEALVEQRIDALEGGARITVVLNASKPDPTRAAEIAKDIETQKAKLVEAQTEADRYTGGLVKALAETSVATTKNTLAILQQQYLIAHYGIATPVSASLASAPAKSESEVAARTAQTKSRSEEHQNASVAENCLKIGTFDSSVLSTNDVFTELAWKVDVSNSCDHPFGVRVTFTIYDKDDFELDSDSKEVYVAAHGIGKARGKMLVNPPEKARRMARQGAKISEL